MIFKTKGQIVFDTSIRNIHKITIEDGSLAFSANKKFIGANASAVVTVKCLQYRNGRRFADISEQKDTLIDQLSSANDELVSETTVLRAYQADIEAQNALARLYSKAVKDVCGKKQFSRLISHREDVVNREKGNELELEVDLEKAPEYRVLVSKELQNAAQQTTRLRFFVLPPAAASELDSEMLNAINDHHDAIEHRINDLEEKVEKLTCGRQ